MPYISIRQNGTELGWRELDGAAVVIGRQKECDVCLIDMLMSRNHCRIERTERGDWVLIDLSSKNGTWHDETPIARMELTPGVRVRVGRTTLTFHPETPPGEGRYVGRAINRPSDPHEALAGTVMGMVVVEEGPAERPADPWAARRASRPRPVPRPAGESGIYPAISEAAVHEPSSGACAILRESRQTDTARVVSEVSEELSVREPVVPRTRVLPRPILLELQVAAEQEERAAGAALKEQGVRAAIIDEQPRLTRRRCRWYARLPVTQEGVVFFFALVLLGFFRLAINPSNPETAVGQTIVAAAPPAPAAPAEPTFDVGVMAATAADLPPLSVTATPDPAERLASVSADDEDDEQDVTTPIKALAAAAKHLRRSLSWESVSGAVKDYQREVRRLVLEIPSPNYADASRAEH